MLSNVLYECNQAFEIDGLVLTKSNSKILLIKDIMFNDCKVMLIIMIESFCDPQACDFITKNISEIFISKCREKEDMKEILDNAYIILNKKLQNSSCQTNISGAFCLSCVIYSDNNIQKCFIASLGNLSVIKSTKSDAKLIINGSVLRHCYNANKEKNNDNLTQDETDVMYQQIKYPSSNYFANTKFIKFFEQHKIFTDAKAIKKNENDKINTGIKSCDINSNVNYIILVNNEILLHIPWQELTSFIVSYVENNLTLQDLCKNIIDKVSGLEQNIKKTNDKLICVIRNRKFMCCF